MILRSRHPRSPSEPAPYWTSYADIVRIAGGVPIEIQCGEASGFLLTSEQLDAAITPRCSSVAATWS